MKNHPKPRLSFKKIAFRVFFTLLGIQVLLAVVLLWLGYRLKGEIVPIISQQLKSEVLVGNVNLSLWANWPELSIQLKDLSLRDSAKLEEKPLVSAKEVSLNMNPLECLLNWSITVSRIKLSGVNVNLNRDSLDQGNWQFIQALSSNTDNSATKSGNDVNFKIKKVFLEQVKFRFQDINEGKDVRFNLQRTNLSIKKTDSLVEGHLRGSVYINSLKFNDKHDAFLFERQTELDAKFAFTHSFDKVILQDVVLKESEMEYKLKGSITTKKPTFIDLKVETANNTEKLVLPLLPADISYKIARFQHDGRISAVAHISGFASNGAEPRVVIKFRPIDGHVTIPDMPFALEKVSCEGTYTNQHDTLKQTGNVNSSVTIRNVKGIVHDIPFGAKVLVTDFKNPLLVIDVQVEADLAKKYKFQPYKNLIPQAGRVIFTANYKTFSKDWEDPEKLRHLPGNIKGKLEFKDAKVRFLSPAWQVKKMNGSIKIDQENLHLNNLNLTINNNLVFLKGNLSGWVSKIFDPNAEVKGNLSVSSPLADVYSFLDQNKKPKKKGKSKQPKFDNEDLPLKNTDLSLNLQFKKLVAKDFIAEDVTGNAQIKNQELKLNIDFKSASGKAHFDGHFTGFSTGKYFFSSGIKLQKVNVAETFKMFNNFNQTSVRHEHLKGRLNFDGKMSAPINYTLVPNISGLKGKFSAKLVSGELNNFEPIANLGNVVFRKRDFKHVTFDEMSAKFRLEGTRIYVPTMEVSSSVLQFYLDGEYDFDTLKNYEMNVRVPLKNVKNPAKNKDEHIHLKDVSKTSVPIKIFRIKGKNETKIDWKQAKAELKNLF